MNTNQSGRWLLIAISLFGAIAVPNLTLAAKKAEDTRGLQPVALAIPGEANLVPLYGESHALVIGAADYNHGWPRLPGVTGDIEAVSQALERQGFAVTQFKNPTGDKLDKALRRFVSQYGQKKDSRLLIYYAGHGHTLKPDEDRQLGYLVPVDAPLSDRDLGGFKETALSMEVIESYAKQIESKHALFVFDACFSGSFFKMRAAPELIALKTTRPVRQFITSGSADQMVPDVSVFRRQFIAGLAGEADYNLDGYVTGSELGSFLEDKVTNYSNRTQTPQYGKIRDPALDKGDFVFVLNRPVSKLGPRNLPTSPGGMNLDDLQEESKVRQGWDTWQSKIQTDFNKITTLTSDLDLQTKAWERFLQTYAQDNPYGRDDDSLRVDARTHMEAARWPRATAKNISEQPAYALDNPPIRYPVLANIRGVEGRVTVRVEVLANGRPGKMWLKQSSGSNILDQDAQVQLASWRFVPARTNGQPVTAWIDVPVMYHLSSARK